MTNTTERLTSAQGKALDKIYENGRWIGSGSIHHATAGALQRLELIRIQERFADGHCRFILTAKGHKIAAERNLATKRAERLQAQREIVSEDRNEIHTMRDTRTVVRALTALGIEGVHVATCSNPECANCTISARVPKGVRPEDHKEALLAIAQAAIRANEARVTRATVTEAMFYAKRLQIGQRVFHEGDWRELEYVFPQGDVTRVGFVGGGTRLYASVSQVAVR